MKTNTSLDKVEMRGIVKHFPGVLANNQVNFDVHAGEIHALLGENGAGKSTLMRILYGLYSPDDGEIIYNGVLVSIRSPADAIRLGIGMVHQHFMLVNALTVTQNVALGMPSSRGWLTDLAVVKARIRELVKAYGLDVEPDARIWQLSVGQQQRVEIIKALYRGASLLILDEPTAVLTPQEVDELFTILKQMAEEGLGIIFISHKLNEIMAFTDRVTVLRDGRNEGTLVTANTSKQELANMMVGRPFNLQPDRPPVEIGKPLLRLENVYALNDRDLVGLKGISFAVHEGEVLGVAGVSGNGQLELAEVIAGLRPCSNGRIFLDDKEITGQSPGEVSRQGLAYIPEERNRDGMIREFSISENLILRNHHKKPFTSLGLFDFGAIEQHTTELVKSFNVKTPSSETPMMNLSGGNAQKVILARELSSRPRVLLASQPTRGLDIGATEYVRARIAQQRREGTATLLISEDLDEILGLSDRIAVMFHGEVMDIVDRQNANQERLGLLMAGVRIEKEL